jgi:hypothetical protein
MAEPAVSLKSASGHHGTNVSATTDDMPTAKRAEVGVNAATASRGATTGVTVAGTD